MTIDETGRVIDLPIVHSEQAPPVSPLENTDMINSSMKFIANALVDASDLVQRVKAVEDEVKRLTDALAVANDQAVVAMRERDAALSAKDAAIRAKEIADAAFDTVNAQRISAEMEAHDLREARDALTNSEAHARRELGEVLSKVAELEAEVLRLKAQAETDAAFFNTAMAGAHEKAKDYEDLYKLANDDIARLTVERDDARQDRDWWTNHANQANAKLNSALDTLSAIRALVS
jgi:chromosome segregation ATPase